MKEGRTIEELAREIMRQAEVKRDFVADTRQMTMTRTDGTANDGTPAHLLSLKGAGAFPLTPHTHGQIATHFKIPKKYYDHMQGAAPDLLSTNVNHWMQNKPAKRMVRTLDGGARAFLSNRYRPIDNMDVAQPMLEVLGDLDVNIVSCDITERKMYLKAVFPKVEGEITVGDPVQSGIVISNSEIGLGALRIQALVYRLVCKNGMISQDASMKKYHVGRAFGNEGSLEFFKDETLLADDRAFMLKVRDTINATADEAKFQVIIDQVRQTTEREIEGDPVEGVKVLQNKFNMNDEERTGILKHLIKGGDLTQYGLMNAVTRQSQDVEDYDRATELEEIGGKIIELPKNQWKVISQAA